MTEVVVARHDLTAGQPVDANDTRLVGVHSTDEALLHDLVRRGQVSGGWVTSVPVAAGEPLTESELARPLAGPTLGEMSIAVPVQQAVGGRLAPGDLVDVIASDGQGGAYYVAQGLRVVAVAPAAPSGALLGASTSYYVVVAVGKEAALRVAAAAGEQGTSGGGVELVRSSGERSTDHTSYGGPTSGSAGSSSSVKAGR
jgi:Flp pilus assembly protein CpaB